jgi:hypothetical protein
MENSGPSRRLFIGQFVVAEENQWFAEGTDGPPRRSERRYRVESQLFAAVDAEAAYLMAQSWLESFSDSNHDGPGDLTTMFAIGLHEIEELPCAPQDLQSAVRECYGVDVGRFDLRAVDQLGVPLIRSKLDLDVFRTLKILQGKP